MERNCWLQRTQLETGLILILMVAIPFLIAMIIVYVVLLQDCKDCSVSCLVICSKRSLFNTDVIPMFLQLNPNISLSKLADKYEICPDSMMRSFELKVDHAFVASVIEDVYIDDITDQRYLGAAVVITFKWVVSSSKYVKEQDADVYGLFVRAGSNYWTHGGSVHDIKRIVFADKTSPATVAAIELQTEFPKLPSIRPIMLSRKSLYKNFGIAEMYGWKSDDSLPLQFRKKYVKMSSEPGVIFKDDQCEDESRNQSHIFCAITVKPTKEPCMYYTGFPVVRARILIGVDIGEYFDSNRNVTAQLIYDINQALRWLETISGVYVDYL